MDIDVENNSYMQGETIVYNATVTNDGDIDMYDVVVTDRLSGTEVEIGTLSVGESEEFTGWYYIDPDYDGEEIEIVVDAEGDYDASDFDGEAVGSVSARDTYSVEVKELDIPLEFKEFVPDTPAGFVKMSDIPDKETGKDVSTPRGLSSSPMSGFDMQASSLPDTIEVDKTAEAVEGCRAYEVSLGITGTPVEVPLDVILVIDKSGSMDWESSSLHHAKEAAKDFVQEILYPGNNNRVAVVTFSYNNYSNFIGIPLLGRGNLNTDSQINIGFSSDQDQVISAINNIITQTGTNIQAGFRRAKNLMTKEGRSYAKKVIILLSDGVANVSIGEYPGSDYPTSHNVHTRAAYQEGRSCFDIADVYTIGLFGGLTGYPSTLVIARDTLQRAQNKGYYETTSGADLSEIYEEIAGQMGVPATNAVVTDWISDNFEFVGFVEPYENATYNSNTHTITWEPGTIKGSAQLTYKIRAKAGFQGGNDVSTNVSAKLEYTDVNGNNTSKDFPFPRCTYRSPLP